jgi:hypothetical protein
MILKDKVLDLFETRFDHASARIVLRDGLARAGLQLEKDALDSGDVRRLASAVVLLGLARVDGLVAGLNALADAQPAPRTKPVPAIDPEPSQVADEPVDVEAEEPLPDDAAKARAGKQKKR